jgi:2-hydroxycyclohexanecarboxyl-CoA dehydrogenase
VNPKFGRAKGIHADLTKTHHIHEAIAHATQTFGAIDMYIDALMISRRHELDSPESLQDFDRLIDVNLKAPIFMTQEILKFVKGRRNSRIVYLLQDTSCYGAIGDGLTAVTRTGLISYSKSLARELSPTSTTVNCVSVGVTEEYLMERDPKAQSLKEAQENLLKILPQARMTDPNEVADLIAYLISARSASVTGQLLAASHGLTM